MAQIPADVLAKVLAEQGAAALAAIVFAFAFFLLLGIMGAGLKYVLENTVPRSSHDKVCASLDRNTEELGRLSTLVRGGKA